MHCKAITTRTMTKQNPDIRKPAVAGLFYPSGATELTKDIATFYSQVDKVPVAGSPLALVVPHAGYPYSGRTAAKAYKLLEGEEYDSVIVVSPSHRVFFKGSSVYNGAGYETPLGVVEIDKELSAKIASIHPAVYFSNMGHASGATRGEHALEVQLPFLQIVLGKFKLVAIVMGDQEEDSISSLGETLAAALKGTNTLVVASTDLSHFHPQKVANRLDSAVQAAVERFDPDMLIDTLESGKGEACGGGIVAAVLKAARRLGGESVQVLEYTTSGETTGDYQEVVGYLSAVVLGDREVVAGAPEIGAAMKRTKPEFSLSSDDKKLLHQIAREAIAAHISQEPYSPPGSEALKAERGVFVTLKINGGLRGCIGLIRARQPLNEAVAEMAVAAAFDDPRFPPLSEEEYRLLNYEISVLSPLERVHDFEEIEVGRDGLMIKLDLHSGLLLPQVASEYGWNRTEFLEQTCLKAGLPKSSYKSKHAEVYRFSAEVF
ncbi:MAG: AmmeMemoRadiSam system protein B [Candidatus Zixiibacteriota bacterium]|nr:MAG: AmmeMemoRadiSam system protein B [candidate division Zixibacteria bacterium]